MKRSSIVLEVVSSSLSLSSIDKPTLFDIWVKFIETKTRQGDHFEHHLFIHDRASGAMGNFSYQSVGHVMQFVPEHNPLDPESVLFSPVFNTLEHLFRDTEKRKACISLLPQTYIPVHCGIDDIVHGVATAYSDIGKAMTEPRTPYFLLLHVEDKWVQPLQHKLDEWVSASE